MNIPNFIDIPLTKNDGRLTDEWRAIFQQLLQELQVNAGNEGLVAPTLSSASSSVNPPASGGQITQVQNNVVNNAHTCQYGTLLYDSNTNQLKVALSDGGSPAAPIFKVIQTA